MKTLLIKKHLFMFALLLLALGACDKGGFSEKLDENLLTRSDSVTEQTEGTITQTVSGNISPVIVYEIYAGQTYLAGKLSVWNDEQNLYVRYEITAEDTLLDQVHLWAGNDLSLVPQTRTGVPIPGQFPYKAENLNAATYEFVIPLNSIVVNAADFCGQTVYIFAHAALISPNGTGLGGETAWSFGTEFNANRWGWYSVYSISCDWVQPPQPLKTETAFAKFAKIDGGRIFASDKKANPEGYTSWELTKNRWGWGLQALTAKTYEAEFFAGAGLNRVDKAKRAGTVLATLTEDGKVLVTLALAQGVKLTELHIYADTLKPDTVAPGQYGFTRYYENPVQNLQFEFPLSAGELKYLIVHGVVQY